MKSPYQVPYVSILQEQPLRGDLDLLAGGFVWVLSASLMCAVIHNATLHSLVIRVYPVTGGTSRTLLEGAWHQGAPPANNSNMSCSPFP